MIEHKCSYNFFIKTFKTLKLQVRERILNSPFRHFLDFLEPLRVDSPLLDDCCRRWLRDNIFCIGAPLSKENHFTVEEIGKILHIPIE